MEPVKKYKIAVVGNAQLALGFKLSGVAEAYSPQGRRRGREHNERADAKEDIGLIITTSNTLKGIRDRKLADQIADSVLPMVIEVPDYKEEGQPDTLRRLIMRAIGIDISKNA